MSNPNDGRIIMLSLKLLSEKDRHEIRQDAQTLLGSLWKRHRGARLGEMGSYELLYKLGRFLNENDSLDG